MPHSQTVADTLEHTLDHDWIGRLAETIQPVLKRAESPLPDSVLDLLHGVPLGHPLHPALVHLPLGGWMVTGALDLAGAAGHPELDRAADLALLVSTVGAVGTIATGWTDWSNTKGAARRDGLIHGLTSETAFLLNVCSLAARRRGRRGLGRLLSGTALILALSGGLLGGQLVYRHGLGVGQLLNRPQR